MKSLSAIVIDIIVGGVGGGGWGDDPHHCIKCFFETSVKKNVKKRSHWNTFVLNEKIFTFSQVFLGVLKSFRHLMC